MNKISKTVRNMNINLDIAEYRHLYGITRSYDRFIYQSTEKSIPEFSSGYTHKDYAWILHVHFEEGKYYYDSRAHDKCEFFFLEPLPYRKISKQVIYVWDTLPPTSVKKEYQTLCKEIQEWVDSNYKTHLSDIELETRLRKKMNHHST